MCVSRATWWCSCQRTAVACPRGSFRCALPCLSSRGVLEERNNIVHTAPGKFKTRAGQFHINSNIRWVFSFTRWMKMSAFLLALLPSPGAPDLTDGKSAEQGCQWGSSWDAKASGPHKEGRGPLCALEKKDAFVMATWDQLCYHSGTTALTNCVLGRWSPAHTHSWGGRDEVHFTEPASQDWAHTLSL